MASGRNAGAQEMCVSLDPLPDLAALERDWCDLQQQSDHSFFQSWTWIGCWLQMLPASIRPLLLCARRGGSIVGLGVFVPRRTIRHGFVVSSGLHLHQTGDAALDQLTIEHNGLLVAREGAAAIVAGCLATLVALKGFDEVHLPGVPSWYLDLCARDLCAGTSSHLEVNKTLPLPSVDLREAAEAGYERLLSRNTRQQVRRAMRLYDDAGLCYRVAEDVDQALADLADLQRLHRAYWTARGQPGAFANPFFTAFHTRLVRTALPRREVELARISTQKGVIGYLYNFKKNGHIYSYQSGFHYPEDNRLKPGLVSHRLAIEHGLSAGEAVYDFLAGEDRYKRSLATHCGRLVWLTLQQPRLVLALERRLRAAKRRTVGLWQKSARERRGDGDREGEAIVTAAPEGKQTPARPVLRRHQGRASRDGG